MSFPLSFFPDSVEEAAAELSAAFPAPRVAGAVEVVRVFTEAALSTLVNFLVVGAALATLFFVVVFSFASFAFLGFFVVTFSLVPVLVFFALGVLVFFSFFSFVSFFTFSFLAFFLLGFGLGTQSITNRALLYEKARSDIASERNFEELFVVILHHIVAFDVLANGGKGCSLSVRIDLYRLFHNGFPRARLFGVSRRTDGAASSRARVLLLYHF